MDKLNEWIKRTVGDSKKDNKKDPKKDQKSGSSSSHKSAHTNKSRSSSTSQGSGQGSGHSSSQGSGQKKKGLFQRTKSHKDRKGVFHKSERNSSNRKGHTQHSSHGSKNTSSHGGRRAPLARKQAPVKKKAHVPYIHKGVLRIIPIGGLNQVGQNMMIFEYEEDIVIIDMGFQFPDSDMLGVDYIIPDISYLEDRKKKIKGVIITHGHLDHTGALPYLLPKLDYPPVYGTKLTMGLVKKRLEEFGLLNKTKLYDLDPSEKLQFGKLRASFFRVAHSIPDGVGVVIDSPEGKCVHTGDFKFDEALTKVQSKFFGQEVNKMEHLGTENVVALFSDSTNALKPGFTKSEKEIGDTIEEIIKTTDGRIIIACFSSLIGRIQQILKYAEKYNRKVFVNGRSMLNNMEISLKLGYMQYKQGLINPIRKQKDIPDENCLVLTTGSQGEAMSALSRMARKEHRFIKIQKGDTIIFSSKPIPGNETSVFRLINQLSILGAKVIHNQIMDVHASGHGQQGDLKRMLNLIKPKYHVPIHGEYFMRVTHAELGPECGIPKENCIIVQNGSVMEVRKGVLKVSLEEVETKYILIDGKGEGSEDAQVMMDRRVLSENGVMVILLNVNRSTKKLKGTPDVITRGFMYQKETEKIAHQFVKRAEKAYKNIIEKKPNATRGEIKRYIVQSVNQLAVQELDRNPLIMPLIIDA